MYYQLFKTISEYIFILGAGQGIFLALFLFNKKENKLANRIFSVAMLAFSLDLLNTIYVTKQLYYEYPNLAGITAITPFIYVPSIFLYTYFLCNKRKSFKPLYTLNFLPLLLILMYGIPTFIFGSTEFKISMYEVGAPKLLIHSVVQAFIPFYGIVYTLLSIKQILKYNERLKESFSNIEKLKLDWLKYLISGIALIWFFEFLQYIVLNILNYNESILFILIYISLSILIYSIAYFGLKQPEIFLDEELLNSDNEISSSKQYIKSGLDESDANKLKDKLLDLMEGEKPYLNSKLSLNDLSEMLDISKHNLSEIINTTLDQNFYDFVNLYRIEEFKRLIKEDKDSKYTLLTIALESGFSSKTTFNTVFKKHCGITPSQYKKENL